MTNSWTDITIQTVVTHSTTSNMAYKIITKKNYYTQGTKYGQILHGQLQITTKIDGLILENPKKKKNAPSKNSPLICSETFLFIAPIYPTTS